MPSQFAMIVRSSEALAGYCGLFRHEVDGKTEIEIGYGLDSACWNRGPASEAARTVRDHGFRDLKLDYVISLIHPKNHPSRRVVEKNGMILERETTLRGFRTFVFAITRERRLQLGRGAERIPPPKHGRRVRRPRSCRTPKWFCRNSVPRLSAPFGE